MATTISHTPLNIDKKGDVYICTSASGSVISTDPEELIAAVATNVAKDLAVIVGEDDAATWTFVKSDVAEHFVLIDCLTSGILPSNMKVDPASRASHVSYILSKYQPEMIAAVEWIRSNTKGKVKPLSASSGNAHYFMFENRDEALLFKLAHGGEA
ncbi:hypothetical protein [Neorhizobium sp. T7_12]|uniref:hypothetical protein n=1 Tax=Neorhizobium sp. T7_12 TaxID=2093832 RepID=UPI000CFA1932|nr:hypothetical protein [Neorhizobium sp. T7_12]